MNENATTYLVKLKPIASFFFGVEQGETADYFLKGNNFPQQTALLGLIRHQLLIQNNLLANGKINDKTKAGSLIGEESFQYNKPNQNFGAIKSLSECYAGYTANNEENEFATYLYNAAPANFTKEAVYINAVFVFPGYDPKNYYPLQFRLLKSSKICKPSFNEDEIFKPSERPGINKNYEGISEEDAYYKQVWLTMEKDFCFAFYLTLSEEYNNSEQVILNDAYITFGKESSLFFMEIKQADNLPEAQTEVHNNENALYLTSDAYLTNDIAVECEIAVADTVPFRNIINYVSQQQRDYFNRKPVETPCSKRLQLYKKGSFFYSKNINKIAQTISSHQAFTRIGYNKFHFTEIKIKT